MAKMELEQKIIADSEELFMRYGIKSVSMDDIARSLGISKKTIYQHFSTKQELLTHVLKKITSKEQCEFADIRTNSVDAIDEIVQMAEYAIRKLQDLSPHTLYDLQKYYRESFTNWDQHHKRHVFQKIRNNIIRGIKEGLYRADINPDFIAKVYIEMINVLTDEEKFPLFDKHFDQLYLQFINYHLRGLVSSKGNSLLEKYLNKISK